MESGLLHWGIAASIANTMIEPNITFYSENDVLKFLDLHQITLLHENKFPAETLC